MKKATITVNFDEEKTVALKLYLEQKGTSVEKEVSTLKSRKQKIQMTKISDDVIQK